ACSALGGLPCGSRHGWGLEVDDRVVCWGDNCRGQLGIGSTESKHSPPTVTTDLPEVEQVQCDQKNCIALTEDGALWTWGEKSTRPERILEDTQVDAAGLFGTRFCVAMAGGEIRCGFFPNVNYTVVGTPPGEVVQLGVGETHACSLNSAGRVMCWCLSGAENCKIWQAEEVALESRPVDLAVGANHSCAGLESNAVVCWGRNEHGQLGTGDYADSREPRQVVGLGDDQKTPVPGASLVEEPTDWAKRTMPTNCAGIAVPDGDMYIHDGIVEI